METTRVNDQIKNVLEDRVVVQDIFGDRFILYSVDVCCGKTLLIGTEDNKLYIKPITDLAGVVGKTLGELLNEK